MAGDRKQLGEIADRLLSIYDHVAFQHECFRVMGPAIQAMARRYVWPTGRPVRIEIAAHFHEGFVILDAVDCVPDLQSIGEVADRVTRRIVRDSAADWAEGGGDESLVDRVRAIEEAGAEDRAKIAEAYPAPWRVGANVDDAGHDILAANSRLVATGVRSDVALVIVDCVNSWAKIHEVRVGKSRPRELERQLAEARYHLAQIEKALEEAWNAR